MRKFLFILVIGFVLSTTVAFADVLNFDDLAANQSLKDVTYQGVFFTTPSSELKVYNGNDFGTQWSSSPNSIGTSEGSIAMDPFTAHFSTLVNFVQITGGDVGNDIDSFRIEVYDPANNLLAFADSGLFDANVEPDLFTLSIAIANIDHATFIPTSPGGCGVTWDDLTFTPQTTVPEPATMLLLGLGLIGLAGMRRKLKG